MPPVTVLYVFALLILVCALMLALRLDRIITSTRNTPGHIGLGAIQFRAIGGSMFPLGNHPKNAQMVVPCTFTGALGEPEAIDISESTAAVTDGVGTAAFEVTDGKVALVVTPPVPFPADAPTSYTVSMSFDAKVGDGRQPIEVEASGDYIDPMAVAVQIGTPTFRPIPSA